jgi:hypothetical protein
MRALVVVTGDKVQIADAVNGASSKSLLIQHETSEQRLFGPGFQQAIFAATTTD